MTKGKKTLLFYKSVFIRKKPTLGDDEEQWISAGSHVTPSRFIVTLRSHYCGSYPSTHLCMGVRGFFTYPKMTSSPYLMGSLTGTSSSSCFGEFIRLAPTARKNKKTRLMSNSSELIDDRHSEKLQMSYLK